MNDWKIYCLIIGLFFVFSFMFFFAIGWFSRKTMYYDRKFGDSRKFNCGALGKARLTYFFDASENVPALKMELYQPGRMVQTMIWTFEPGVRGEQSAYMGLMEATDDSVTKEAENLISDGKNGIKPNQKMAHLSKTPN